MNSNERSIMVLTMIAHCMVHVYELSVPILIGEWKAEFTATPSALGWIVFFGYAVFGLGSIPAGILADRYDSQFLLALCLGGMGASFLFIGFTPWFAGIGVFFFIWGIFASIHHPTSLSLISRSVSRRGTGFAYHGMAGNVGIALGPLFTTILLMILDWRTVTFILALPALFAVVLQLWISFDEVRSQDLQNTEGSAERVQFQINSISDFSTQLKHLFGFGFFLVFIVVLLNGLYYRGILTFLPEVLRSMPVLEPLVWAGQTIESHRFLYSGMFLIGILGQYLGGRITDYFSPLWLWMLFLPLFPVISLLYIPAAAGGLWGIIVVSGFLGLFMFMIQPINQSAVSVFSDTGMRGLAYGCTYLAIFGVGSLGAPMTGYILDWYSINILFYVLAAISLLGFLCGFILFWVERN